MRVRNGYHFLGYTSRLALKPFFFVCLFVSFYLPSLLLLLLFCILILTRARSRAEVKIKTRTHQNLLL